MTLPPKLFSAVKDLLLPYVTRADEREALLIEAFYLLPDSRLYHQIQREGMPLVFCMKCLKALVEYGCIAPQEHSVSRLLEIIHARCGADKQQAIDRLIPQINQTCGQPATEATSPAPAPTPPSEPLQSIQTPLANRTATVFVSYSHRDTATAQRLLNDLHGQGHACWIDLAGIKGGDEWMQSIRDGINNSYAFVILCTHQALASRWVRDEILWARQKEKLIIPLLLEDVTQDDNFFGLHTYQGIFVKDYEAALAQLIRVLPSPQFTQSEPATITAKLVTRRQLELDYLERLLLEELLHTDKYTALGGSSQRQLRDEQGKLRFQPVVMRPEFEHSPWAKAEERTEIRRFENAVEEILVIQRAVLLGEPGAGKTTTLWKLAREVADKAVVDPQAPLPIVVRLGKWLEGEQTLLDFIAAQVGTLGAYLNQIFSEGRAVLLLDGMNEIPVGQRDTKYSQIKALIERYPDWVAVVSCREQDYTIDLGFDRISIMPLDPLRILEFAQHYLGDETGENLFWKLAGNTQHIWQKWRGAGATLELFFTAPDIPSANPNVYDVTNEQDDFLWLNHIKSTAGLMALARNPYMLSMLTQIYDAQGDLPSNRGELFKSFVEILLLREHIITRDLKTRQIVWTTEAHDLLTKLGELAYQMQIQRAQAEDSDTVTALPLITVQAMLGERLTYLAGSASVLSLGDEVRFTHQLLQEYFVALYMQIEIAAGRLKAEDIWQPDRWWERTNWEEATILLAGLYSDDCTLILNWIAPANPEVTAQCILRSGAYTPDKILLSLRDLWLPRLMDLQYDSSPLARAAVGRAAGLVKLSDGTLLDNRSGVSLRADGLPDIEWVEIPAGKFWYGIDKSLYPNTQDNETPRRELDLPTFYIAKYPITYSQFQSFIDATDGFANPQWWVDLAVDNQHKAQPGDQAFPFGNHPRERVSWYDAIAFTRWLSMRLGYMVRLPTEFEWEKAARGTDGRIYPYGNEFDAIKSNTSETGIGQTSVVGIFPNGTSPYEVSDMSGNIEEWCLNKYHIDSDISIDGKNDWRVLRGGSWKDAPHIARTFSRDTNRPTNRIYFIGFRLVRVP